MNELKIYRGVMCHDNEEWCKVWRGIDLSVQNWREEFNEFWPEHSNRLFWPKYIMLELKKYWGVMFDGTQDWCRTWMTTDLRFQKWHEEFCNISTGIFPNWFRWKSKDEPCLMTLKSDAKVEKKIDSSFQKWHEEFGEF